MRILYDELHQILDPFMGLTLMGEGMLQRILENPAQPMLEQQSQGYGIEAIETYDTKTSFLDLCRQGKANGVKRMDVFYDFFFGGNHRENYPDSPITVQAYKRIHDLAREHGMGFAASVISPLDTGGGYVQSHSQTGQTMQFQEGIIHSDGTYETVMDYQIQWTNNKGPAPLRLKEVKVFAFDEERIGTTPFYYVDEREIEDISDSAVYRVDPESFRTSRDGYGHGDIWIHGTTDCRKTRFLAVVIYQTLEIDYFADDALDYMKSILDLHKAAGISYDGIYSDEMHIQFDWDYQTHWGKTEVTTRYMTDAMARVYGEKYGAQYRDFTKYLVYFAYMHHDFLEGDEGQIPAQHVFGKSREEILRTFRFRRDYFELLHRQVVDLCKAAKAYAETLFGKRMQATGHSTWQESPTIDIFKQPKAGEEVSRYDYTNAFWWSAAQRENISACNDHFKWNEFFWAVGTDIPEGGFLDRNYYGAAYTAGLAALNPAKFAYYCIWGAPDAVKERLVEVGQTYGHYAGYCKSYELGHSWVQGATCRLSDVLTVCPTDLNYLEERFGNWMVQYGYTDYITEEKLLEYAKPNGKYLQVKERQYRALVVTFSPLMSEKTLTLLQSYLQQGGTVIWCSAPALCQEAQWKEIFGIRNFCFDLRGIPAKQGTVHFDGFRTVEDMPILSDLFPDDVYPVTPGDAYPVATMGQQILGTRKDYPHGGCAAYLGFRVRDDQSCSTGEDVDTLFEVLRELDCYDQNGCEILSRPAESRYICNRFPNGAISLSNHFRTFREQPWPGGFYRDEAKDDAYMRNVQLPPHDITLENMAIGGHRVSHQGEGILTYRYSEEEGLQGFAGRNTCGISIDGNTYTFTQNPSDLVWGKLDERISQPGIREAYILKCSSEGEISLPFDAGDMHCALCGNYMLETTESYPFATERGITKVNLSAAAVNRWLVFYKK